MYLRSTEASSEANDNPASSRGEREAVSAVGESFSWRGSRLKGLLLGAALGLLSSPVTPEAKNLELLARVLIPAYMAQNFTAVCIVDDPSFLEETARPQGHVYVYAKHVKDEVSSELSQQDVEAVLKMSADTARSIVRKELADLKAETLSAEGERLRRWCDKSAKPFVREVIGAHFEKHNEIERIIGEAKRD